MNWIDVNDRLPEFGQEILLWMVDGDLKRWGEGILVRIDNDGPVFEEWSCYYDGPVKIALDVTHWMNIDPPSKERSR